MESVGIKLEINSSHAVQSAGKKKCLLYSPAHDRSHLTSPLDINCNPPLPIDPQVTTPLIWVVYYTTHRTNYLKRWDLIVLGSQLHSHVYLRSWDRKLRRDSPHSTACNDVVITSARASKYTFPLWSFCGRQTKENKMSKLNFIFWAQISCYSRRNCEISQI